ncbi:MAG: isoprenylcysteine carboxylmethyltransferase family protein [Pirellulaceae bacterium]|nr:isoprenylcysteine carboxylmethyltransferase family protein [Pirellulaceae bacterium]MDP7020126.1 isoprenylcysteine carboxylmethyltransferase family protein [Pirellulaceae bacterium]
MQLLPQAAIVVAAHGCLLILSRSFTAAPPAIGWQLIWSAVVTAFALVDVGYSCGARSWSAPRAADRSADWAAWLTGQLLLALFLAGLCTAPNLPGWLLWLAPTMVVSGALLRAASFTALGKFFVSGVIVVDDQPLIRAGIYRFLRHPSETAILLAGFGSALAVSTWWAFAIWAGGLLPVVVFRARREDRCLERAFGSTFLAYRCAVRRFVPFVY